METILLILIFAIAAFAAMHCPFHPNTTCISTGQTRMTKSGPEHKIHCTCGDEFWIH